MSEGSIQHGIFEITSTGKTQRYFAEDFGGAQEALSILHLISLDMRRTPKGSVIDVNRLISRFEKIPLDDLDTRLPMFVPLEQSGYERRMAELEGGDASLAHYAVDYDHDRFSVTSWNDNELTRLSAPLDGMINSYSSAMRFVDPVHYTMDDRALVTAVREIAEVQIIREGPFPGQTTGPVM